MLHERPGVQTSRQVDENQASGDYQMHVDIMDYPRGITTTLYIILFIVRSIHMRSRDFGSAFGHWNSFWGSRDRFVISSVITLIRLEIIRLE